MLKVESIKKESLLTISVQDSAIRFLRTSNLIRSTILLHLYAMSLQKTGQKDLIKIDNVVDLDFDMLGLLDPNITVVIIENEEVHEKVKLSLPKKGPRYVTM